MVETVEGIERETVTTWFLAHVDTVEPPLRFDLIAGGHSNLTYKVTDIADRAWVLRRPPLGQVLATAHDMSREHKIISALGPTEVPVPSTMGLCTDETVNRAPFYVMNFVEGLVVRDSASGEALSVGQRRRAGESIVDTLAAIHQVDPDAVGLGDLGRKEGYIGRQLKRWYGQWNQSKTRELPMVDRVHDRLLAAVPDQGSAGVVHGDYRLDNCMIDGKGNVVAVLDWEICTLGDPMADLGLLMVYWSEAGDRMTALPQSATALEGFPTRAELIDRYAEASGRDLSQIDYYVAFGYWKLACILEGVYARYIGGAMGGDRGEFGYFADQVEALALAASEAADRAGL